MKPATDPRRLDVPASVSGRVGRRAVDRSRTLQVVIREEILRQPTGPGQLLARMTDLATARSTIELVLRSPQMVMGVERAEDHQWRQFVELVGILLKAEIRIVNEANRHIGELAAERSAGRLASRAATPTPVRRGMIMKPATDSRRLDVPASVSGRVRGPDYASIARAAEWICGASGTLRGASTGPATLAASLYRFSTSDGAISTVVGLQALNASLIAGDTAARKDRQVVPEGQIPCSETGKWLLRQVVAHVGTLPDRSPANASRWKEVACFLLGGVIRAHGFADGNGRTARAAYAICHLRAGLPFTTVSSDDERQLSGLRGL